MNSVYVLWDSNKRKGSLYCAKTSEFLGTVLWGSAQGVTKYCVGLRHSNGEFESKTFENLVWKDVTDFSKPPRVKKDQQLLEIYAAGHVLYEVATK